MHIHFLQCLFTGSCLVTSSLITGFREGLGLGSQTYSAKYLDLKTKRPTAHRNELADEHSTCVFSVQVPQALN